MASVKHKKQPKPAASAAPAKPTRVLVGQRWSYYGTVVMVIKISKSGYATFDGHAAQHGWHGTYTINLRCNPQATYLGKDNPHECY